MKTKKAIQEWISQTEIGDHFGLTSIEVGKILIAHQLKDTHTGHASEKALDQDLAKSAFLKNGTPHFLWHAKKIPELISKTHRKLSRLEYWTNRVRKSYLTATQLLHERKDELAHITYESALDEVPSDIVLQVENILAQETTAAL